MSTLAIPLIAGLAVGIVVIVLFGTFAIRVSSGTSTINDTFADYRYQRLPEKVWMVDALSQCAEPWDYEDWTRGSDGRFQDRTERMVGFIEGKGVTVYETKIIKQILFDGYTLRPADPMTAVCEACGCTALTAAFVLVPKSDVDDMEEIGFGVYYGDFSIIE